MSLLKIIRQKKLIKENMKFQTQDSHDLGGTQDLFTRHESQERKKKDKLLISATYICANLIVETVLCSLTVFSVDFKK